jgi:hypothetical protein
MATQTETGHAKIVANFGALISAITAYGAAYNPSKPSITLSVLYGLNENAKNVMKTLNTLLGQASIVIAAREVAFEPLSKLTTRILNALRASDSTQQVDDSVQSLVRKIQGKRATPKKTAEEKAALQAEGKEIKEVSSSQMGFDNRLASFDHLIQLLSSIPQYAPNEEDLKVYTLTNIYNTLAALNTNAVNAEIALSNARISRNEILYKTDTGLVDTAASVKMYIKSLYGATSPQYKQVSGLAFKSEKI